MRERSFLRYLWPVLIGTLFVACGGKDQYSQNPPPPNPNQIDSSLIKKSFNDSENNSNADSEDSEDTKQNGANSSSAKEVFDKVGNWHLRPVVWNKSVGNIEIGKTDFNTWWKDITDLYSIAKFQLFFAPPSDKSGYNSVIVGGAEVASTIKSVNFVNGYLGPLELPKGDGVENVKMGDELSKKGFFTAARNGSDLNQNTPSLSTRGREFFKKFYNRYVKKDEGGNEYDCFATGVCAYVVTQDQWGMVYNSPREEFGYLYMGRANDALIGAHFSRPDIVDAGTLSKDEIKVDLLSGSFVNDKNETVLKFGDSFAKISKQAEFPEQVLWSDAASPFRGNFTGLNLNFQKTQLQKLGDPSYDAPDAKDTFVGFTAYYSSKKDFVLTASDRLSRDQPISFSLLDEKRKQWARGAPTDNPKVLDEVKTHYGFLNLIKTNAEAALSQEKATILQSRIRGLNSLKTDATYNYQLTYILPVANEGVDIIVQTRSKSAYTAVQVRQLQAYEVELYKLNHSSQRGYTFGGLALGDKIELTNLDPLVNKQATVTLNNQSIRVPFVEEQIFTRKGLDTDGNVFTSFEKVSAITLANLTINLRPSVCESSSCYEIIGLSSNSFYQKDTGSSENPQSFRICNQGITIHLGMSRRELERKILEYNTDLVNRGESSVEKTCTVALTESEIGKSEPASLYLPADGIQLHLGDDDNTSLSKVVFYKKGGAEQ